MSQRNAICGIDNCRSRRYHIGDDGFTYCSNGHRAERRVVVDDDEFTTTLSGKKTKRKQEKEEQPAVVFTGVDATKLYLQCYQLILWKQAHWLIHVKGYPAELEGIIRNLWLLRMQTLPSVESLSQESSQEQYSSITSKSESELEAPRRAKARKLPHIVESLCLCYLSLVLLQLPISFGELNRWLSEDGFTFVTAFEKLPDIMTRNLAAEYCAALQARVAVPKPGRLQRVTTELVRIFATKLGMVMPPINHHLMLFSWIQKFALPLETFVAVERLARIMDYGFSFRTDNNAKVDVLDFPSTKLMALLIVVTKLLSPFDDVERHPATTDELGTTSIDWSIWNKLFPHPQPHRDAVSEQLHTQNLTADAALDCEPRALDNYMDWFEMAFANDQPDEKQKDAPFRRALLQMFPLQTTPPTQAESTDQTEIVLYRIRRIQETLKVHQVIAGNENGDIIRPGAQYTRYKTESGLPDMARKFFESAAETVALSLSAMVRAVYILERRLEARMNSQRPDSFEDEIMTDD